MKLNSVASDVVGLRLRLANAHEAGREETILWGAVELAKCPACPCSTASLAACLVAARLPG